MHSKSATKSRERRSSPFLRPEQFFIFSSPRRSSHLRGCAEIWMRLSPLGLPASISFTTRMRSRLGRTHTTRPAERFHAGHAEQPETSQARQDVVCYGRIVDFPAFPRSPSLSHGRDAPPYSSYSSWDSHKSERSS